MATNGPTVTPRGRRRRRPLPLRAKIGLAGIAAVGAAWLIPKGGTAPEPIPTPTPTRPGQLTAAEFALSTIPAGVSFKSIDGVRVFLVRNGTRVVAFQGLATTPSDGPIVWCRSSNRFESSDFQTRYGVTGKAETGSATRDLDTISVIAAAGRVTIFPHRSTPGRAVASPLPKLDSSPCPAADRVG